MFKFPNNLAYSSKTSCSSGVRLSSPSEIWEALKFCSGAEGSEVMVPWRFSVCFEDEVVVVVVRG